VRIESEQTLRRYGPLERKQEGVAGRNGPAPVKPSLGRMSYLPKAGAGVMKSAGEREETEVGRELKSEKRERKREYVVIQRLVMDGKEREWKVWGTTDETGLEWVREEEMRAKGEIG
jgi:hypothetical protein